MRWIKSRPLISAPEPTFVLFSPLPEGCPKFSQGREAALLSLAHFTFSSLLHSDLRATAGYRLSWSWSGLYPSHWGPLLRQAGYEFHPLSLRQAGCLPSCPSWPSPFTSLLKDKEQPWCFLVIVKDFQLLSLELASGTGHRGVLLEAGEEEEAGSGTSRYALILDIFLLTCSKQQHRAPWSLLGGILLSHAPSVACPTSNSAFCCRMKAQMGQAEQGWTPRGPMLSLGLVRHELFIVKREGWGWSMVRPSYPLLPSALPKCPCLQGGVCASVWELHQANPFFFMDFWISKAGDVFQAVLIWAVARIRAGGRPSGWFGWASLRDVL